MQGLSDAQKDAVISQLGLTGMKQLIEQPLDDIDRLDEAQKVGIVMDADLVKRGGELNDEFETMSKVIGVQLKSALVDLGPILLGLLQFTAKIASGWADILDGIKKVENRRTETLQREREGAVGEVLNAQASVGALSGQPGLQGVAKAALAKANEKLAMYDRLLADRAKSEAPPPAPKPGRSLIDQSKTPAGPRDDTAQRTDSVAAAVAGAERDVLQATLALATSLEARTAIQKAIAAREAEIEQARLDKQIDDIKADKGLSEPTRKTLVAQLSIAKDKAAEAARLKQRAIDDAAVDAAAKDSLDLAQQRRDGEAGLLQLQDSLTRSDAEHLSIALRLVDLAYQREKAELEGVIASKTATEADKEVARLKLAQLNAQQPGRTEQAHREGSPAAQHANQIIGGVTQGRDLAAEHAAVLAEIDRQRQADVISERDAVQAKAQANAEYLQQRLQYASNFFGALAGLSESNNSTLAAIGKAAAITQATIDGVLAVQNALAHVPFPFNFVAAAAVGTAAAINVAKIAGLKDGGWVDGPGGTRDDKVLRRLSRKEFVVHAGAAALHGPLLEAMNAGRDLSGFLPTPPRISGPNATPTIVGGGDVHQTYAPQINLAEPSLERLLTREGRAMRTWMRNEMRNNPKLWRPAS
jgi:hypothetical protein